MSPAAAEKGDHAGPAPEGHQGADSPPVGITREEKAQAIKVAVGSFVVVLLAVWILIPIFWGSNYRLEFYFYRLTIDVYDFDSASSATPLLGPIVARSLIESMKAPVHFTIRTMNTTGVTLDSVSDRIVNEKAWAAIVINANATAAWTAASSGVASTYQGDGAISVVVASARFFQVILEYLLPFIDQLLETPISMASKSAAAQFLASATPASLAALTPAQSQALATPFGHQVIDLRPILSGQWSGSAPLEAGLIYFVIFAFHVTLFSFFSRIPLLQRAGKDKLYVKLSHFIALRLVPVVIVYLFLSLWYSLVNVAFNVPMDGNGHSGLSSQAGFMGLAMEFMITLLTIKFFPMFLITWIITNVTSSFFPPTLMETFYRYGYAMPFYNSVTADKFIFWGARNRLGLNFGVLAG
ncbi:hypothetical protein RQP46_007422 [Phenoliferia psychrophenolica]